LNYEAGIILQCKSNLFPNLAKNHLEWKLSANDDC